VKPSTDHEQNEKAVRLVEYLLRLASLRSKLVRDISAYDKVLWLNDIPRQNGCFTQAWGRDKDYDPDIWAEVQNRREPELPSIPDQCKDWIDKSSLRNKSDLPELLPEITKQIKNPAWQEESDEPEFVSQTKRLEEQPTVKQAWDRYLEERWLPWTEEHNVWESIHKVYSSLFAIYQEQLRLGEEYELVLGLGFLTWQTPTGHRVRRHLIVANALLKFEARLGKFTVQTNPDGASLRPELDMLDIEEQPARAEEIAKSSLTNAEDDPWEKDCIEGVLSSLVHSINSLGEYDNTLVAKNIRASTKPIVEYAPALILRKRSAKGLTETLRRIKGNIEIGGEIPREFRDLAEIPVRGDDSSNNDPVDTNSEFDGELFFPKLSNEEQRHIVNKIRGTSGVLVQGPPGTGKSHTIANLISHLLATGQRILVTAKTPRALQVLMGRFDKEENEKDKKNEGLISKEIRPLCISLLGSGPEEKNSLDFSVKRILLKNEEWNQNQAKRERQELEQKLRNLREEKANVDRRLLDIRESETHSQSIAEGNYRGTAARIAETVNQDRSIYEWFTDTVPLNKACPISGKFLTSVLAALRQFTPEIRQELSLVCPDALPSSERLANLFKCEEGAIEEEDRSIKGADVQTSDHLARIDANAIKVIRDSLADFQDKRRQLTASPYQWMGDALCDVMSGNPLVWRELHRSTRDTIGSIETLVPVVDQTSIDYPDDANTRTLLEDVRKLKEHMENGGKLGWWLLRPRLVKECIHVLKTVRVNGHCCSSLEQFSVLADALRVHVECEKACGFWVGRCDKPQGPYPMQLAALKAKCDALDGVCVSIAGRRR